MKTRLFKYIETFTTKKWKCSDKKFWYLFIFLLKNIDCGYSLEPPRGGSNEYPQSMFLSRNKKTNVYPVNPSFAIKKWGLRGSKLYRHVFMMNTLSMTEAKLADNTDWSFVWLYLKRSHLPFYVEMTTLDAIQIQEIVQNCWITY